MGAVGYESSAGITAVTSYVLDADVAVNSKPVTNAAVTFTDPNGIIQYPLTYSGSNQVVGGVTCALYQDVPASFTTVGAFSLEVVTTSGTSSASVTAINSVVSFSSPYTSLSWTGSSQQNTISIQDSTISATSYSQTAVTSPITIPSSTYMSGTTYNYTFIQLNQAATIMGGTGSLEYLQTLTGTFVAP